MVLGFCPRFVFKAHCFTVSLECGWKGLFNSRCLWHSGNETSATVDTHLGPAEQLDDSFRVNLIRSDGDNLLLSADLRVGKGENLHV